MVSQHTRIKMLHNLGPTDFSSLIFHYFLCPHYLTVHNLCPLTLALFHIGSYWLLLLDSYTEIYPSFWAQFKCRFFYEGFVLFLVHHLKNNLSLSRAVLLSAVVLCSHLLSPTLAQRLPSKLLRLGRDPLLLKFEFYIVASALLLNKHLMNDECPPSQIAGADKHESVSKCPRNLI